MKEIRIRPLKRHGLRGLFVLGFHDDHESPEMQRVWAPLDSSEVRQWVKELLPELEVEP